MPRIIGRLFSLFHVRPLTHMNDASAHNEVKYVIERRQRLRVVMIALPAMVGLLMVLWSIGVGDEFFYRRSIFPKEFYLTLAIGLLGFSGLVVVMTYLQTGFKRSTEVEFETLKYQRELEDNSAAQRIEMLQLTDELRLELQNARAEIESAKSRASNFDAGDRSALVAELKTQIFAEANSAILADLKTQVAAAHLRDSRDKDLLHRFDESRFRLSKELEALSRRGNLNLALGALTTVIGIGLLGLSVFSEITEAKDWWAMASHFVPRLTLVVMIELFAYFFLSLYKTSLQEIKYFQNEITNVEAKQIALRAALSYGEQPLIADIAAKLAATERNHILSKDQTTVELEKARIDKDGKGELAKYVAEFFQKKA